MKPRSTVTQPLTESASRSGDEYPQDQQERQRLWVLLGSVGVLAVIAGIVWTTYMLKPKPPPDKGLYYYTGPMRNKSGTGYGTDAGKVTEAPAGEKPLEKPGASGPPGGN